ncbi:MAG: glycerophosphodiester phosphodiesterase [Sandaracinaceae bacterium]|nr:glycerophosphodiester phosphodiesterase [Sandaracinaceae bacterium]
MSIVCGHRGLGPTRASGSFPENTIESIQAAIEAGATMVEFDVQLSADDVPVLMHDDTLDRTTSGRGCVSAFTLAELRTLDAGVGTPLVGQGVRVATLGELLSAVPIALNVEIKVADAGCRRHDAERVAEVVLAALAADPRRDERHVLISSFDLELLRVVRGRDATVPLGWLIERADERTSWVARARDAGCQALHPHHAFIDEALAQECRAAGLELNTWTVNQRARAEQLVAWGVRVIITDDPAAMQGIAPSSAPAAASHLSSRD